MTPFDRLRANGLDSIIRIVVPPHPIPLPRWGEGKIRKVMSLAKFLVEDDGDEDGREDQEHVAEGEAPECARGVGEFPGEREIVFHDDRVRFGRVERDHGVAAAAGADAYLDSEECERIEEGDGEYYSRRQPELVLEDAGEGEDEGDHPEGGFGLHAAVGGGVLVADVEAAGAEFLHSHKDNRLDFRGSPCGLRYDQ